MDCICMYAPSADGGMARYAWEVMTALARHPRAGRRFELVTQQDLDPQFRSDAYTIHSILPPLVHRSRFSTRLGWAASRIFHYARRERCFLRWLRQRPDVAAVHLQEWTPWLAAPLIRRIRKLGKRVYYTVHNVVPHRYPRLVPRAVMNRWIRSGCRSCDGLFVHTETLAQKLSEFLDGRPHPPIHVVPHGVWTVRDGATAPAPSLDDRLAVKRLLFFGTIRPNKGLDVLLRAAAEHLPDCPITIAGEPHDREYLRAEILPAIARLRALGRTVELHDRFVPDAELPALFARHSAIVLPYTSGFVAQSGVAFLALAYDMPLVVSDVGGLRDLLAEYSIGVTFRGGSAEALAAAVRELFDGDARRTVPAEIRAAKTQFTWSANAAATIAGYDSASPCEQPTTATHDWIAETTPAR